jgi:CRISPR-associated protein Csx17
MTGHVLTLHGCTPEPLGNYLKGLGVFRLIAEQADPQARAWWKDGVLHVIQHKWLPSKSASAESQCVGWLLQDCHFTPLIAPWQTGTGYLPIGKREAGGAALLELLKSDRPGTSAFQDVFRDFATSVGVSLSDDPSQWLEEIKQAGQDHADADLIRLLRNRLRAGPSLKWLDAVGMAAARSRNLDERPSWFPLLASGGGEASGQYIVNHQQRLRAVLNDDQEQSRCRLDAALFGLSQPGALEGNTMGAMYYPSLMKVPNAGQDFLPNPQRRVNPWDFILLFEGCLVWSMATTRRKGVTSERASFPFYCRSSFGGSTTIGPKEVEGSEKSVAKGELWCPTWEMPSTLSEVQRIFGEGRLQVGEKACSRSLDFALAMTAFGVDRGINAFHRYSLLERSGSGRQTTLLAVSNGCFVPHRAKSLSLLKDLQHFAESVSANLTDNGQQPRRLMLARIEFERSWFEATTSAATGDADATGALSDLVMTAGRLNRELGTNSTKPGIVKIKRGEQTSERSISPVGDLHRDWSRLIDNSAPSSAYRLARAIAGITAWGELSSEGRSAPAVESIRTNLLPVQRRGKAWAWDDTSRSAVWSRGASLAVNLVAVLRRRLIDAERDSGDGLPLWSMYGVGFEDLLAYWNGEADEDRLTELLHGLALIDTGNWSELNTDKRQWRDEPTPDLQTGAVWFEAEDEARTTFGSVEWNGRSLLSKDDLRAAFELPRSYHLLKLCFVGGRLPHRPVEGRTSPRTGDESFPPSCLDVLTILQAGRLPDAAQLAARRLRAKGYPSVLRDSDLQNLNMDLDQCRRLAGMLLIPVRQPGVCAALAIKPQTAF